MTQKFDWEKLASPVGNPEAMREAFAIIQENFDREDDFRPSIEAFMRLVDEHYTGQMMHECEVIVCQYPPAEKRTAAETAEMLRKLRPLGQKYTAVSSRKSREIMRDAVDHLMRGDRGFPEWVVDQLGGGLIYTTSVAA